MASLAVRRSYMILVFALEYKLAESYLMVVAEELIKEINGVIADEPLILSIDEAVPALLGEAAENIVILSVELNVIFVEVVEEVFSTQDLGNLDQLVRVAVSMEEGLLAEDHGCKHGAQRPHVKRVVVLLEVDKELRALEVAGRNTDVVFSAGVVELSKTPVDESQLVRVSMNVKHVGCGGADLALFMIDHDVVRFDVSVHNTLAVAEVQGLYESALHRDSELERPPSAARKYRSAHRNPGTWGIGF